MKYTNYHSHHLSFALWSCRPFFDQYCEGINIFILWACRLWIFDLHRNEIQLWFTSHFLHLNNDTLQHRALHDSRISGLWPISVSLLPPIRRLRSLLKHASRSSTFILAIHLELMLIYVMHEIFFINLNSQFNLFCRLSNLRHHICINSCLFHFSLACFPWQQYSSHMTSLPILRQYISIIMSHSHNLNLSYKSHHKSNKPW